MGDWIENERSCHLPNDSDSPHGEATAPNIHTVSIPSSPEKAILDRFILVVDEWLSGPVLCNVNVCSRCPDFQEKEQ